MKIILLEDVENVGHSGETVVVADGYARNFLIPNGLALQDSKTNRKMFDHFKRQIAAKKSRSVREAQQTKNTLDGASVEIKVQVGEEDKMYGAVTAKDIASALAAKGYKIDRHKLELPSPIKTLGTHEVQVKLYQDINATVKVWVVK